MSERPTLIKFDHVGIRFGSFVVHEDISLEIDEAEVVTLLGPSGAGKTLILKLIMGLLFPSSGSVNVLGKNTGVLSDDELHQLRKEIGMLFQGAALFDSMSVADNISYSLREEHSATDGEIKNRVDELLTLIGLPEIGHKFPAQLSGGQKKRVGLARALASRPKIMLFDEPTTGLDPTATRLINSLILRLKSEYGITSLVVTHDIASARTISSRWILLKDKRIGADGPVEALVQSHPDVRRFIEGKWFEMEDVVTES